MTLQPIKDVSEYKRLKQHSEIVSKMKEREIKIYSRNNQRNINHC